MSILTKDFKFEQITSTSGSTVATEPYSSTGEGIIINTDFNIYLNDMDWSKAPKGVYLYQESMVSRATLGEVLFNLYSTITTIINGVAVVTATPNYTGQLAFLFEKLAYESKDSLGTPVYTLPYGWLAYAYHPVYGISLCLFVGYSSPIIQSVDYALPYSTIDTDSVKSDVDALLDQLYDPSDVVGLSMLDGYETNYSILLTPTYDGTTTGATNVTTTAPAQDEYVGASTGLTYTELLKLTNAGWNSWARSIDPLNVGEYIVYTVATGVTSACIGIGVKGLESDGIGKFTHSIIADSSGVKIYESAVLKTTLYSSQTELTGLRIYRMSDNSIVYVAVTGTDTRVYTSLVTAPAKATQLYAYGYLFVAEDKVTSARYRTGEVQYGSV